MQLIATVTLNAKEPHAAPPTDLREAEFQAVRGLYMDGFIQQIWVYADGSGSSMIVEAPSAAVAADRLGALPMVRGGYLTAPTVVALAPYWGFGPRS
ncbi:hypothetical protein BRW65_25305 [Mycobacterium paraffinicum]|uniref:Muconolactone isomerase domain-containing protein n=1 Tax=Mycobacterium paraffinicum TaxID=53378 RepID=A0A1Q4HMX7_9MYCO|nr:hypothetical protein [Mycobacterium paraffinicum]OJZ68792.1 hypothetical protein BRW65_25305 [Mycobacterium paraffinicum]